MERSQLRGMWKYRKNKNKKPYAAETGIFRANQVSAVAADALAPCFLLGKIWATGHIAIMKKCKYDAMLPQIIIACVCLFFIVALHSSWNSFGRTHM